MSCVREKRKIISIENDYVSVVNDEFLRNKKKKGTVKSAGLGTGIKLC